MKATGRDGCRWPWSYREQTGSSSYTISSSSGTVSTGYMSTGSHLSWMSMEGLEAARHFEEMEKTDTEFVQPVKKSRKETEKKHTEFMEVYPKETAKEKKMKQIKSLVKEFFGGPSAKCSIEGADMSVLERWFAELGVGWVFHLADGARAPVGKLEQTLDAQRWFRALTEIMEAFCLTTSLFPGHGSTSVEEEGPEEQDMTEQVQFASFTQQAMLKMLASVDVIIARDLNITCDASTIHLVAPYQKLNTLLRVRRPLSKALSKIRSSSYSPPSAQVGTIHDQMVIVLSAKEGKAGEAIWSTMEEIRNRIVESVEDGGDSSGTQTLQGSSDIHKATRSVISYIRFLQPNYSSVAPIVCEAASLGKYAPQIGRVEPLDSLIAEMASCVQEKLANKSEKFQDQSLRFLFLLNNSSFIGDQLHYTPYFPESYKAALSGKVEGYIESYMQESWAPVLSCLFNPKPIRLFGKNYSPLLKFESEFQKIYITQKLWKVPDPELRKTLREAIIKKIIPGYTKYIEDNKVTTLKFTPQNLEETLQELFEG